MIKGAIRALSPGRRRKSTEPSPADPAVPLLQSAMAAPSRKFDLAILGATGFTGRLCAEYIAKNYADTIPKFRWALAGRSAVRLRAVAESLSCKNQPELVLVDTEKFDTVRAMAADTFVVLNTAGPFEKYGTPVVEACAYLGTNYCDITGEVFWCKEMEERYGEAAKRSGALIVPMCGYDSVPADIGTFVVAQYMQERLGKSCGKVKVFHHGLRGGMSGGTIGTMCGIVKRPWGQLIKLVKKTFLDAYSYNPGGGWRGGDSCVDQMGVWFDLDMMRLTSPFVMATVNTRVVRRSAGVLGYGAGFRYEEKYAADWTPIDVTFVIGNTFVPILMMLYCLIPPVRWFAERFILPSPGTGPSKKMRESGKFTVTVVGRTSGGKESWGGAMVVGTVVGTQDPGYGETSKMVCESALAMALQKHDLPGKEGGFHTPASGLGMPLVERLRSAGMTVTVDEA